MPILAAHAEDRHDVGVVQPRRRLRLPLEPTHLLRVQQRPGREHLQRHAAAQRLLLGLVDHAHPAPADLAEDAVVPQPLQPGAYRRTIIGGQRAGGGTGALAQVFHHEEGGEEVADLLGQLGVPLGVFAERRVLAAAPAIEEVLGQELDRVAGVAGGGHRSAPSPAVCVTSGRPSVGIMGGVGRPAPNSPSRPRPMRSSLVLRPDPVAGDLRSGQARARWSEAAPEKRLARRLALPDFFIHSGRLRAALSGPGSTTGFP